MKHISSVGLMRGAASWLYQNAFHAGFCDGFNRDTRLGGVINN